MGFEELKGQKRAVELLKTGFRTKRISHAYIFYGPKGTGKSKGAEIFARLLNCEHPQDEEPCDTCSACRRIKESNYPDFIRIQPEGKSLKISQIRPLREKAHFKCYEGRFKVIMIDDAHLLTTEAANSLLKVLEDPPEETVFLLLTEDTGKIPVTVMSRCQPVPFQTLDEESIRRILQQEGIASKIPLSLARGSVGRALELERKLNGNQLLMNVNQMLSDIKTLGYKGVFNWAEEMEKNREIMEAFLDILAITYRDRLVWMKTGDRKLLLDKEMLPGEHQLAADCYAALESIGRTHYQLSINANTRLALEVLLLDLRNIECGERGVYPND